MDSYQSIGYTKKTYGIKGELKLNISDNYLEDFAQAEVVFLGIDGRKIPHFIDYISFERPFCIKFEDYHSKEAVIPLTGKEIFLRQSDLLPIEEKVIELEELFYQKYIGFSITDRSLGFLGEIQNLVEYPQQEMAVIHRNEKEILIPMNEHLILSVDEENFSILMDLPMGILEID